MAGAEKLYKELNSYNLDGDPIRLVYEAATGGESQTVTSVMYAWTNGYQLDLIFDDAKKANEAYNALKHTKIIVKSSGTAQTTIEEEQQ